ncbi:hypothetical protein OG871_40270 (plasmid) [Kitasatospora sp. NBC_00374]|uniref:hypothetical protein n=1 Tax=Kitasatospora sp. NBC_00374 TaxID=2975964 RepID=UPI002F912771
MTIRPFPKAVARVAEVVVPRARRAGAVWRSLRAVAALYWPGRRTVLMTLGMTYLFMVAGTESAFAADGERGGVLAPLNVLSSEGVPLDNYDLKSENGGTTDIRSHVCNLLLGAGFALVRLLVGFMCWVVQWIWNFPIVSTLIGTANHLHYEFFQIMANDLSLYGLFLAAGVAFGGLLMMRGKVGRGAGEMLITLMLSALVLMPALTPRSVLGEQGPVVQAQQAAHQAGQLAAGVNGPDPGCTSDKDKSDPSCPMRMMLTRTLVVQPYQLLQYGIIPSPDSTNQREKELADVHYRWIHGEIKGKDDSDCGISWMPGSDVACPKTSSWDELKNELKRHGNEGKAAYNFAVDSNWDRVGGVALVLLAVLLIAIVVVGMALVHIGCQFADVIAASLTAPAGIWAMLPGGNRAALWKWLGIFLTSVVTELAVSVMLPMFALGANGILTSPQNTVMIQRLLILDGFAVVLLVFHRRVFAAAGQLGDRFANRMRFARIGGTLFMGENTGLGLAMSQALGNMGQGGSGGGYGGLRGGLGLGGGLGGGIGGHSALLRKARIAEGLSALADPGLGKMNAAGMAAGAYGEFRRGMAMLSLPVRAAHQLAAGNPLPPHKLARRLKPVGTVGPFGGPLPPHGGLGGPHGPGGPGGVGGPGRGGRPGGPGGQPNPPGPTTTTAGRRVLMPRSGVTPLGHTVHNRLLNTRAGRLALLAGKAGKLGWNVTGGAPATLTRLNRAGGVLRDHAGMQWQHYSNVRKSWWADEKAGARKVGQTAKGAVNTVAGAARHQYLQAAVMANTHVAPLIDGMRNAYESARDGAAVGYDLTVGDPFQEPSGRAGHHDPADHGQVWEHAQGRSAEYPFFETEPSGAVLQGEQAGPDQVVVRAGRADSGPADIWAALGPDVVPAPEPIAVVEDEPEMVVDRTTGEIFPAHQVPSGPAPAPPAPAVEAGAVASVDPAMDPSVLRRVSPRLLGPTDPARSSLEAWRMRAHLGHRDAAGEAAGGEPGEGTVGGPDGGLDL